MKKRTHSTHGERERERNLKRHDRHDTRSETKWWNKSKGSLSLSLLFSKKEKVSVCVRAHVLPGPNERTPAGYTHTHKWAETLILKCGKSFGIRCVLGPCCSCCRHIPLKKFVFSSFLFFNFMPFLKIGKKKESIAASIGLLEVKENKINEWKWSSALAIVQHSHTS